MKTTTRTKKHTVKLTVSTQVKVEQKNKSCDLRILLENYLQANKALDKVPSAPAPPAEKISYSVKEWDQHQADVANYKIKIRSRSEKIIALTKRVEECRIAIVEFIPKAHKWFTTEDKRFAVALQGSNWPGDQYRILYRENPVIEELPALRRHIIN
jgi:hypothetical protein